MPILEADHEDLDEIQELNRLFLRYLKRRLESQAAALDLPAEAVPAVRRASLDVLDQAGQFPRALFALRLEGWMPWRLMDPPPAAGDVSYHSLQLTILHSAWSIARRSVYSARLFLGLTQSQVKRLRATPLGELHGAALGNELVGCAFADADWLWRGLMTETEPERLRQLRLLALQPNIEDSAQASAQMMFSSR